MTEREPSIRTLIADDETLARNLLATLVRRDPALTLVGESSNGAAALEDVRRLRPDLVLLDVQMPLLSGLQVVERLVRDEPESVPHIVLVTAFDDYAVQAFELDVLDYLVKPVEKERFALAMKRARSAIRQQSICRLTERLIQGGFPSIPAPEPAAEPMMVRRGEELVSLQPAEIVWVEAANQYARLHTDRGEFLISDNLAETEKRLSGGSFIRVHRSVLINGPRARQVLRKPNGLHQILMDNGQRVAMARSRRDLLPLVLRWATDG